MPEIRSTVTRRHFVRSWATAGAVLCTPVLKSWSATGVDLAGRHGSARRTVSLNRDWSFEGKIDSPPGKRTSQVLASASVTLPHCVSPLSWQNWNPDMWQDVWSYRRNFEVPHEMKGLRLFLHFDRVMASATPVLNGHTLPQHLGGFLPFEYEITGLTTDKGNSLTVAVDSRWNNIPPAGSPKGPASVDYMLPGGISGAVELRGVPHVFLKDVFAKPANVLSEHPRLDVTCNIDCDLPLPASVRLEARLYDGNRAIANTSREVSLSHKTEDIALTLDQLSNLTLWDVERPHLYKLLVTLFLNGAPIHTQSTAVGFREARFTLDGFFLNGKRLQLFGLNRHELYPYVGFSMPDRVVKQDAKYLRHSLNCNIVRCSHYPQSEAFLNACDEIGLLVWEEIPGWQYLGDENWRNIALQNTADMIRRDRNHPSIVVWGTRINESANDPALYRRTREVAKSLDDSRSTSGSMTPSSRKTWQKEWHEDVFAFDDYHADADGSVGIDEPLPGVPYMLAEAVGQYAYGTAKNFSRKYRRAGDPEEQAAQALLHAQAHSRAAQNPRSAGLIAWCAFDYASLMNSYAGVKCPGVVDTFRIPKLGASFYLAQGDPRIKPVIEPSFYWDFGPRTPRGPGNRVAIFSNCERLEIFVGDKQHAVLHPDEAGYPHLRHPPFFVDLNFDASTTSELRIDGFVSGALLLSRSFSPDRAADRLWLKADDQEIQADGSDATRVAFGVVDKFGSPRLFADGEVLFQVEGPADIIGDNPFRLADSGGVGAVWLRSRPDRQGKIKVSAQHTALGKQSVVFHSLAKKAAL